MAGLVPAMTCDVVHVDERVFWGSRKSQYARRLESGFDFAVRTDFGLEPNPRFQFFRLPARDVARRVVRIPAGTRTQGKRELSRGRAAMFGESCRVLLFEG